MKLLHFLNSHRYLHQNVGESKIFRISIIQNVEEGEFYLGANLKCYFNTLPCNLHILNTYIMGIIHHIYFSSYTAFCLLCDQWPCGWYMTNYHWSKRNYQLIFQQILYEHSTSMTTECNYYVNNVWAMLLLSFLYDTSLYFLNVTRLFFTWTSGNCIISFSVTEKYLEFTFFFLLNTFLIYSYFFMVHKNIIIDTNKMKRSLLLKVRHCIAQTVVQFLKQWNILFICKFQKQT